MRASTSVDFPTPMSPVSSALSPAHQASRPARRTFPSCRPQASRAGNRPFGPGGKRWPAKCPAHLTAPFDGFLVRLQARVEIPEPLRVHERFQDPLDLELLLATAQSTQKSELDHLVDVGLPDDARARCWNRKEDPTTRRAGPGEHQRVPRSRRRTRRGACAAARAAS